MNNQKQNKDGGGVKRYGKFQKLQKTSVQKSSGTQRVMQKKSPSKQSKRNVHNNKAVNF